MVAIRALDITEIEPRIVLHAGGAPLVIPGGNALLTAEFHHLGPDLLIHNRHGTEVLVHDYFAANHAPALMTESGLRLDGDLVTALARPEGYLQLAQDQTAQADTNGGAQPIGKVDTVTGSVDVHHADGSTAQLAQGAPVFQGDIIQTGADGQIGITFVDGTAFSLQPGARMTLDDLVYSSDGKDNSFSASVLQGTFVFMAGKIAPSGHMEVKTPVGTIGIRGTTVGGHLSMDGNDNTIVLFRDAKTGHLGKVEFTNAGGTQILDAPNASTHVTSYFAPPSSPIPLPPQDAQQYFNDMLQHFYDQHGGAPTGNQGYNNQPGHPTADELADQMDLGNFNTAAGSGAHGHDGGDGGGRDPQSGLLGYVPPLPTTVVFTSLSLTGGLLFGATGLGEFGSEGPGHITQDNLGQVNQGENGGFTVINGTPGNDSLGSSTLPGPVQIFGNDGDDVLIGSNFNDQIHGGGGNDILDGGAGNDQVFGDAGNDTFDGGTGLGDDYYDGGDGVNTVEYSSATLNLTVNLTTGTASGDPDVGSDTLVNIENVIGGSGNDTIIGNAADNVLYGGAGNDTLMGMGGNDTLYGGVPSTGNPPSVASGIDTAVFQGTLAQYSISETENGAFIVTDSHAGRDGTDTLIDIARVKFADGEFNLSDLINRPPTAPADADTKDNAVQENAETGTAVGITASSTDPNGTAITYKLTNDSSNGGFQVDAKTGVVTVLDGSKIDYETAPGHQYQITVQASDGHVTSQSSFTIGVDNEAPSTPADADASTNQVAEGAATGTAVGITASSTDPAGGTVTYILASDSSTGGFQVNATTGVVTVADGSKIDYETAPGHQYQITVQASDGHATSQSSFTIGVGNAAPSAPADANTNDNTVQEHAVTGTAVGITASSTDPAGGDVIYSLAGDSSNGGFQIDAKTGVVTVLDGSKIDYGAVSTHSYQITVEASDGTLKSDSSFTIQVQSAPPPSIDLDANNSSGDTTTGYKTNFSGQPVAITDSDTIITAADGAMIASATLKLTGVTNQSQEALVAGNGLPAGISVSSFTYSNGVGTLVLSGFASAADYAAALESIQYKNGAGGLAAGSRTVTVSVTDDIGHVSNTATTLIDVAATAKIIGDVINGDPLIIGNIGHGEVDIFAGGQAPVHQIIIGNTFTGNGLLQLNPGSTAGLGANTAITVGNAGIGQISVSGTSSAHSEIDASEIVIGAQISGNGSITLHGGSEINATGGTIAVGERGIGFLTVQGTSAAPSTAIANQVVIGDQNHSGGVLLVDGSGSSLITKGDDNGITVGNHGTGFLGVSNGGQVETLSLEIGSDGTGNTIIGGTGTKVLVSNATGNFSGVNSGEAGFVRVGKTDDGNGSLSVIAGALLAIGGSTGADKAGPTLMIADETGSQGNVIIDGDHSTISLSQPSTASGNADGLVNGPSVIVGHQGDASLTVQNHALLSLTGPGASIEIGVGDSDSDGPSLHLPQSVATVSSGGHITLTDNSNADDPHVAAGGITVGGAVDGNGKLVVTGAGSIVTVQSIDGVTIGDSGDGTLAIAAGGVFSIQSHAGATQQSGLTIARNATANGSVTVSGTGSQLQILSPNIGAGLMEGPFLIMAAGQSLFQASDHANVLIQGEGANFVVGSDASSLAQASILGGATMTVDGKGGDATVVVASQAGSQGSLTIDGTHSQLTIQGETDQMLIGTALNNNQDVVAGHSGDADVKVSNGGTLEVGPASSHGTGPAEIVIGDHGSLDIANGKVIGDISDQGGEISIGHNVIATAALTGDLSMTSPASTLEIDASGTTAGHADKLNVTGDVALTAATIDFHFLNNYAPHAGDTFSFLTASDGISADLSDISLVAHNVSSSFRFELLASEHDIQFHALTNAGTGSSDVFLGGDKNDTFAATGNNNVLFGGAGDDTLIGGNTGNLIQGGAGADHMIGGKGADTFSFVLPSDGVQVSDNSTVAKDSASFDHITNFDAKSDTISFAPGYSQSTISTIDDTNFSKINGAYNGTNGTSAAYNSGNASFILDGNNNLIYDNNGSKAGYTIVAHIDVAHGSPAITAHNLHVA